ncbi:hypothetical protein ACIRN4_23890 [Pimelobacter simplex]|uniref:hypothetical protein n=1 Tax=Nocardioides simplex TaxID=2045 RepID=UPI00381EAFF0
MSGTGQVDAVDAARSRLGNASKANNDVAVTHARADLARAMADRRRAEAAAFDAAADALVASISDREG